MVVSTVTFTLKAGVSREDFLRADKELQEETLHQDPDFIRRTVAHNDENDEWMVVSFSWERPMVAVVDALVDVISSATYTDIGG